jgi:hypothetical protein
MPYNYAIGEQRLRECNQQLQELFANLQADTALQTIIQEVKEYYQESYSKAVAKKTEEIITRYELFINQLTQIKNGQIKSKKALETIEQSCESRKNKILFYNLSKACESIFYAATAFSLYTGLWWVALPTLIVQPLVGIAVSITFIGALLSAVQKSYSCLSELRFPTRHNKEYSNERSLILFFHREPVENQKQNTEKHLSEDFSCCWSS